MSLDAIEYGIAPLLKYEIFSVRQIKFLIVLHKLGGIAENKTMVEQTGLAGAVISRIVDKLCIINFVTRRRHEHDGRRRIITMTDKGNALIDRMRGFPEREGA
jgi:DNA-binding MarR family transcriptional regulator